MMKNSQSHETEVGNDGDPKRCQCLIEGDESKVDDGRTKRKDTDNPLSKMVRTSSCFRQANAPN